MMFSVEGTQPKPKAADCLLIGDSLTNYYYTNWNDLYTGSWNFDAYGVPGAQIDYIIDRINDKTIDIEPYKTIFIFLGINNLAAGDTPAFTASEMDRLLDVVKRRNTYIISTLPLDNSIKPDPTNALAQELNSLLRTKGNYINCYDVLATGAGGANPYVYTDGIHLLQSGYDIIQPIIEGYIDFT